MSHGCWQWGHDCDQCGSSSHHNEWVLESSALNLFYACPVASFMPPCPCKLHTHQMWASSLLCCKPIHSSNGWKVSTGFWDGFCLSTDKMFNGMHFTKNTHPVSRIKWRPVHSGLCTLSAVDKEQRLHNSRRGEVNPHFPPQSYLPAVKSPICLCALKMIHTPSNKSQIPSTFQSLYEAEVLLDLQPTPWSLQWRRSDCFWVVNAPHISRSG